MKKIIVLALCMLIPLPMFAQDGGKTQQIGLTFSNLNDFGLSYKIGSGNSLLRVNSLFFNGASTKEEQAIDVRINSNCGAGLSIGQEFHKSLDDRMALTAGADISFRYSVAKTVSKQEDTGDLNWKSRNISYIPGLNLVLGFQYGLSDNILLGGEVLPSVSYTMAKQVYTDMDGNDTTTDQPSSVNYGFSIANVRLILAYRF